MIKLATAPAIDLVVAADVRSFMRMSSTDYDAALLKLAQAARQQAENFTRRAFITQTWQKMLDASEVQDAIKLPRPPLLAVSSVTTYNDAGTPSTQDPSTYTYDNFSEPGWLTLLTGHAWNYCREYNGMLIEYTAGYGPAVSDVPAAITMAVTEAAAYAYVNGKAGELPEDVMVKLKPYIVYL